VGLAHALKVVHEPYPLNKKRLRAPPKPPQKNPKTPKETGKVVEGDDEGEK
jgi:hypothetical protein